KNVNLFLENCSLASHTQQNSIPTMTERPDSPEIEILKEVKRPLKISTAPISRLNATEIVALQSENGRTTTIAGSANRLSPPSFAATRELYRRQRQEARERGFTTGSSEDRMYAQVISNARQSTGPPATLRLPTLPFTSIAGTTTLSSNGKPQAIVQPLCSTVREGTLVPLFGSVPSSSGTLPNGLVKVTDHQYQTNARAAAFAASVASVGQTFVSSATTPLFPNTTRLHHQTATPPQANTRVLPADVFVDRPGAVAATATAGGSKPSVSVSERNVRPINLHDLLLSPPIPLSTSPNRTKPRLTKIVTQFSKQSSVDRCVDAVLNSVRRQPTTSSADVRERPALLPEKYYSRSLAFYGPEEEEEEYKGRFQCEWSGCDDVLPSNVSFVNHLLAHFLKSPVKLNADVEGQSDVSLADFCRCHFCFSIFGRPFDLQSHLLEVHSSRSARLNKSVQAVRTATCFICERAFASFAALQNHMGLVHQHPDAPYWCRKCRFRSSLHRDVLYIFVKVS
uniref:C2H2-type domain-containing protein n=1 Tax=Plectus sambesii TaxID=2011161 RepID=A0A914V309_9BILA